MHAVLADGAFKAALSGLDRLLRVASTIRVESVSEVSHA